MNKKITVVCLRCGAVREVEKGRVVKTYCQKCSQLVNANEKFIGKKINRLTILSYERINGDTYFRTVCECGIVSLIIAHSVKTGHTKSCGCFGKEEHSGEKNYNYNPNLTEEDRLYKRNAQDMTWGRKVKKRDGVCVVCGSAKHLIAHHLNNYANNKELRNDLDNGVTVCRKCHVDFHCNFMGSYRTPCTKEDFDEYLLQI